MTIAALIRGRPGTYNALFVDTGAVRSDGVLERHDKLANLFGETFATCVGDASILKILAARVALGRRPNLRERATVSGLYDELAEARRTSLLLGVPVAFPPQPPCTTLLVCNRAETFFWKVEDGIVPDAPSFVEPDSMVVMRGVTVVNMGGFATVPPGDVAQFVIDQLPHVDAQVTARGAEPLGYTLDGQASGVVLPHKTSDALQRTTPTLA
jgi:hypothetical protein